GIHVGNDELGGAGAHARHSGVASLVVADAGRASEATEALLAYFPANNDEEPPRWDTDDPIDRLTPEAGDLLPASPTGSYDIRQVIAAVVDGGEVLEVRARFGTNVVTAFATLAGRPVGVVGNQPMSIAGTLDI